jgi:DNA-directed RNA polymerase specialized sigma24 family protein
MARSRFGHRNVPGRLAVYVPVTRAAPANGFLMTRSSIYFEEVYRAHWAPLVRLAFALSGSREVAEDVVHDAFVRVSTALEELDNPAAYLRVAVVNGVRDRHRRVQVAQRHPAAPSGPAPGPDLDETWEVLQALPERYRSALVLRFYADLSVEDVARLLRCRPGTAPRARLASG